ncbi:MAG: hypothetical protein JWM12_919, partial [Ilumatobacteraceae bacterium]|nr:hypothetical protein [Ilumatobacteraceae bacterium]
MARLGFSSRRSSRSWRFLLGASLLGVASGTLGVAGAGDQVAAAPVRPEGAAAVQPDRVLDTRIGLGAPVGQVRPGNVLTLAIPAARSAGATSVVLNVTATEASGPGWVKVWPCGAPEPTTSALNFEPAHIAANAVVVGLGNGSVCMSTYAPVHLVADLSGWFTGTNDFTGTTPNRVLDTRTTGTPLQPGVETRLRVAGTAGVAAAATIAALNLTVVGPPAAGWVVAYPCGTPSNASTVNFNAGEIVANLTFVALAGGDVCLRSYATTDVVVDTYGWSNGAGALKVQSPSRLVDTRTWAYGQLHNGSKISLRVAGRGGVPNDAAAALITVTDTNTSGPGFVTVWPCDQPLPNASTINTWSDQLRSNLALVKLAADGTACLQLYTSNSTPLDLVVDAVGWETGGPSRAAPPDQPTAPTPPTTTVPSQQHFGTLPVGAVLPTDAQCAAAVRPAAEIRPANASFNNTRGSTPQSGFYARVTGNFTGTTDEIIQWVSCKWGIDEDIVRAQTAKESGWFQRNGGDFTTDSTRCVPGHPVGADGVAGQCPESIGMMQVRYPYWSAAFPSAT